MTDNTIDDLKGARFAAAFLDYSRAQFDPDGEQYDADPEITVMIGASKDEVVATAHAQREIVQAAHKVQWGYEELCEIQVYPFHRSVSDEDIRRQLWTTLFTHEAGRVEPSPAYAFYGPSGRGPHDVGREREKSNPVTVAFAGYIPWPSTGVFAADGEDFERRNNHQFGETENLDR